MRRLRFENLGRFLVALTAALHCSCMALDKPDSEKKPGGATPAADLCNEMGNVKYSAAWAAGKVTVTAKGTHNTGGYEVSFRQSAIEVFPPQFSLTHKRPAGIVTQAITPFTVSTSFAAAEKPAAVTVHDAHGPRQVPVD